MKNCIRSTLFTFAALLAAHCAYAENSRLMLSFGGSPGDPVAHAYDYGLPDDAGDSYAMRVPVLKADLSEVFYDTLVTVKAPEKIVERVDAERAYKSLGDCNKALALVNEYLQAALPAAYRGGDDGWQHQSPGGEVVAAAGCAKRPRRPFFVLTLVITQTQ